VIAPDVNLGPFHADALPAVVGNLSFVEENLGTRVDAVVGLDLLNQSAFTIDYGSKKLTLGSMDPSLARIPYEAHAGYAVIEMKIQRRSFRLLVDTGASDLMLFEDATRDCPDAVTRIGTRTGSNMGGEMRVQEVKFAEAYLGSMPWGTRHVFIMRDSGENQPDGLGGLLGVASLNSRRVGFDPEHKVFGWDTQGWPLQFAREARR
jgi:Aspartyl protease